jgi:hypothetical protein
MGNYAEVTRCTALDCAIYPFREGLTFTGVSKQKAVRSKCVDCLQSTLTKTCVDKTCPLFDYRDGHRPKSISEDGQIAPKRVMTPEHLEKLRVGRLKHQILDKNDKAIAAPIVIKKKRRVIVCPEKDRA